MSNIDALKDAYPVPSLRTSGFHKPTGFAIFRALIGKNNTGGRDYWVTVREFGENIAKNSELIGVVEGTQVKVGNYVTLEVAEHLQRHLDRACSEHARAIGDELSEDEVRIWTSRASRNGKLIDPTLGRLQCLSHDFAQKFEAQDRYFDGPKKTDALGTRATSRAVTVRYFVAYAREEIGALKKSI